MLPLYKESRILQETQKPWNLKDWQKFSCSFSLVCDEQKNNFFVSKELDLTIKLKPNGYIPRSGLNMVEYLNGISIQGSVVYDIGTGECGLLAYYAKARGADKVIAIDKDVVAIIHAKTSSVISHDIFWIAGDTFSPITPAYKFDLIFSNPPQMPMQEVSLIHDYGGYDGREVLLRILSESSQYLNKTGSLFLLIFDFLGVTKQYNTSPTIIEIANNLGLDCNVRATYQRTIRNGGKTEQNLAWIRSVYPDYKFQQAADGNLFHEMLILECQHL